MGPRACPARPEMGLLWTEVYLTSDEPVANPSMWVLDHLCTQDCYKFIFTIHMAVRRSTCGKSGSRLGHHRLAMPPVAIFH